MAKYFFVEVEDDAVMDFRNAMQKVKGKVDPVAISPSILDALREVEKERKNG